MLNYAYDGVSGLEQIQLAAYGKVNMTLDIVGKRTDGYHLLQSVMQSISTADQVTLTKVPDQIRVTVDLPNIPTNEDNTAWQAADAFFQAVGITGGVEVHIAKKIPAAAGLGGGTADGAAVLYGLNKLYGTNLSLKELQQIGSTIGADVPFCLLGGTALVEGIGEKTTVLPALPEVYFVLIRPDHKVSTASVYKRLSEKSYGTAYTAKFVSHLTGSRSTAQLGAALGNALETVTAALIPEIEEWKERLLQSNALGVAMSGSGPTVFGLFERYDEAYAFVQHWKEESLVMLAHPVGYGVKQLNGGDL